MKNKELKSQYKRRSQELTKIINDWNPYGLLNQGTPEDEFSQEVALILPKLIKVKNREDVAQIVSEIFTAQFDESFSPKNCDIVSSQIFDWWQNDQVVGK